MSLEDDRKKKLGSGFHSERRIIVCSKGYNVWKIYMFILPTWSCRQTSERRQKIQDMVESEIYRDNQSVKILQGSSKYANVVVN